MARKLYHWRSAIVILTATAFTLGIPSLPNRPHHIYYWGAALLAEIGLIFLLLPLNTD